MNNGQCVGLIEVLPINYVQLSSERKCSVIEGFNKLFRIAPDNLHFKLATEKADIQGLLSRIREATRNETDPRVIETCNDCIQNILGMQNSDTYCKKFYCIWEYTGDSTGHRSNVKEEIIQSMYDTKIRLISCFREMANTVVIPDLEENVNPYILNILYKHFNPNSSQKEGFDLRGLRVLSDYTNYNATHEQEREISDCDYIAPRGFMPVKDSSDTILLDGMYYTYLILNSDSYPWEVYPGWIANLVEGREGIDIDLIIEKQSHDLVENSMKLTNHITLAGTGSNNPDKAMDAAFRYNTKSYILRHLKSNEDLYSVMTILTLRSNSFKMLRRMKKDITTTLKKEMIHVTDSFQTRFDCFRMTMPFMYINRSMFAKYKHDVLTSSMAGFYWFSASELFDPSGVVLGINESDGNNTIACVNNFNRNFFPNPHITITGTSGAGKTVTEEILGYNFRLIGMKCIFIVPAKATIDYKPGCDAIGGFFAKIGPHQKHCINLLEIRPQMMLKTNTFSLVSKKVIDVQTFLSIALSQTGENISMQEMMALDLQVTDLYEGFGITSDNESIWEDKEKNLLKTMPIMEDLYEKIKDDPALERIAPLLIPFIKGSFSNMNGQTNVDLDNPYIVFDVDENDIGPAFFLPILYLIFSCADMIAKRSLSEYVALFLDEFWKILKHKLGAEKVKDMIKTYRAYHTCLVLATQDIEDYFNTADDDGKKILNNAAIRIFLRVNDEEFNILERNVRAISADDAKMMQSFPVGHGMIIVGQNKIPIHFKASDRQIKVFTPDEGK